MKIGILGVTGRMGRAIGNAAAEAGVAVAGGIDREGRVHGDHGDAAALAAASDVLVDFSAVEAFATHLGIAIRAGKPILIGTTGLTPGHHVAIDEAARTIPVLQSANTSLGINLLRGLVEQAAVRLGPDWDIEVLEMHHRHKVDAPSGTALLLGQSAAKGRGTTIQALSRFDRIGFDPHAREEGTIGYASLRGGSVAGDHMVIFATEGERIELGHRAESRTIFARGAVKAALWLADKLAGRYTMQDVLGL
ncbi:4-hydroxy-tetrahydrodipicolinate reductase [Sphingomonas sp. MAH-20]|uniref:4-hydroxy-tetrahydrodipicolinate reductase n=1 Tax=Sphingomonas horti TaxID=2682842 RepID=A0A6I4J249_9SPHN|nr:MULTISPECIES: 4-hydroxy-tetrahydrodipicolinate reductase [Sphingomonas]MBA2919516.1 4-hydroxy-tetrahydrodipicolinate reductase [Sphingomonas sp. CGMCC 1.13658]MVO78396.1 4-hydroxy-tetrahydrodipicolinate reductase [Sphingomonas horti]